MSSQDRKQGDLLVAIAANDLWSLPAWQDIKIKSAFQDRPILA